MFFANIYFLLIQIRPSSRSVFGVCAAMPLAAISAGLGLFSKSRRDGGCYTESYLRIGS